LLKLVKDARRFIMATKPAIESNPLQAYASALLFSPTGSLIRSLFRHEEPKWIAKQPVVPTDWSACLQTLEGHSSTVNSVAFSHDSKLLASASFDTTVKVWDAATGTLQQTLEVDSNVRSLSFDVTNSILITNIGHLQLDKTRNLPLFTSSRGFSGKSHCKGLGVSGSWVLWNGQNLLWLPPDFRATTSVISYTGSTLAIGCQSGKVFIIGINISRSKIL
jgi:WD40 repeat protein